jgi:hypothetical protein
VTATAGSSAPPTQFRRRMFHGSSTRTPHIAPGSPCVRAGRGSAVQPRPAAWQRVSNPTASRSRRVGHGAPRPGAVPLRQPPSVRRRPRRTVAGLPETTGIPPLPQFRPASPPSRRAHPTSTVTLACQSPPTSKPSQCLPREHSRMFRHCAPTSTQVNDGDCGLPPSTRNRRGSYTSAHLLSGEVEQPDDRWDNVGYLGCSIDVISSLDKPLLATTSGVGTDQCTLGPGTISPVTRGDRISV